MVPPAPSEYFWVAEAVVDMAEGDGGQYQLAHKCSGVYTADANEGTTEKHFLNIRKAAVKKIMQLKGAQGIDNLLITKLERIG